jgi:hypothetical protein
VDGKEQVGGVADGDYGVEEFDLEAAPDKVLGGFLRDRKVDVYLVDPTRVCTCVVVQVSEFRRELVGVEVAYLKSDPARAVMIVGSGDWTADPVGACGRWRDGG